MTDTTPTPRDGDTVPEVQTTTVEYFVPVDPMDDLQCDSCQ